MEKLKSTIYRDLKLTEMILDYLISVFNRVRERFHFFSLSIPVLSRFKSNNTFCSPTTYTLSYSYQDKRPKFCLNSINLDGIRERLKFLETLATGLY